MSYCTQKVIAQAVVDGLTVMVKEGLNDKSDLEIRVEVPKARWAEFESVEFVYEKRGTLYFAHDEATGKVSYYHYAGPSHGMGGSRIPLNMKDGSVVELIGPWTSRSACMNKVGFEPCKEVNLHCRYNYASNMTVARLNTLLAPLGYELRIDKENDYEIHYSVFAK